MVLDPYINTKLTFGCLDSKAVRNKLITVCIHGDEIAGLIAVNELIEEGFFEYGLSKKERVTIMIGNPEAVIQKKRFIDINLNRIFTSQFTHANLQEDMIKKGYELSRLNEIVAEIQKCDSFLDIHSTSAPTLPFAIVGPTPQSEKVGKSFPVKFVLHNVVRVIVGTSVEYAHSLNKEAVCVECGQHNDRDTVEIAKETIRAFVTGVADNSPKEILSVESSETLRRGFKFCKSCKAFGRVKYHELIAHDDVVGDIRCPFVEGAFLIMPIANPVEGEEAWLWGRINPSQ